MREQPGGGLPAGGSGVKHLQGRIRTDHRCDPRLLKPPGQKIDFLQRVLNISQSGSFYFILDPFYQLHLLHVSEDEGPPPWPLNLLRDCVTTIILLWNPKLLSRRACLRGPT